MFEHCLQATIYISSFRNCVIANVRKWQCSYNSESVSPQKELRFYFPVTKPISKFNPFIYNKFMYWKTLKVLTIFINHQSKSPASLWTERLEEFYFLRILATSFISNVVIPKTNCLKYAISTHFQKCQFICLIRIAGQAISQSINRWLKNMPGAVFPGGTQPKKKTPEQSQYPDRRANQMSPFCC